MNPDPMGLNLSFIAFNRIAEERAAKDKKFQSDLERRGKPLLSQARAMADAALLQRLHRVGIEIDKESFAEMAEHALAAEEMAKTAVTTQVRSRFQNSFDQDWVWLALTVLWERWFPHWPNFEQLDDRIQAGYALADTDSAAACEKWFRAWEDFLLIFQKGNFKSIEEFDGAFRGTQYVFHWIQDFENALLSAAWSDLNWQRRRLTFCEQFLEKFSNGDDLTTENFRRALGSATFALSGARKGDGLFEQWLKDDPRWGWGWIGWADCYHVFATDANRDLQRAEALLKQGLSVSDVRAREDILERLAELCREQGRHDEAEAFEAQSKTIRTLMRTSDRSFELKSHFDFGDEGIPLDQLPVIAEQARREHEQVLAAATAPRAKVKVGRNDPCPCGSGKKYKKCCLAKDEAAARQ
jgi:hypothetical protein